MPPSPLSAKERPRAFVSIPTEGKFIKRVICDHGAGEKLNWVLAKLAGETTQFTAIPLLAGFFIKVMVAAHQFG